MHFRGAVSGVIALAIVLAGCGGNQQPPPPSNPGKARETLVAALDAWKAGKAPRDLEQQKPAILVSDHAWRTGQSLKNYTIQGDGKLFGNSVRFQVQLEVGGAPQLITYIVTTDPVLRVSRDDAEE